MVRRLTLVKYPSNNRNSINMRTYSRKEAVVFRKTKEEFGGLSNMATGFTLKVNGLRILTSEALYQACRFPHMPAIQRVIIGQRSPMTAKMKGKPHRWESRADWERVKVKIMRWCLRVKLAQNWTKFSQLLLETGDRQIVEESRKDDFWGAKIVDGQTLRGNNVLGRLLMELRTQLKQSDQETLSIVEPLEIPDFLLDGRAISTIFGQVDKVVDTRDSLQTKTRVPSITKQRSDASLALRPVQGLLFDSSKFDATNLTSRLGRNNRIKLYPTYKDSGIPWLGKVPEHWSVMPNRTIFKEQKERGYPHEQMLSVTITQGVILQSSLLSDSSKKDSSNEDKSMYKLVCPGDIAYNKMRAWQGAVGASNYRGIVSPAYIVIRPRENQHPRFFHYLFRTPTFTTEAERWSYGISSDQWSLRPEEFKQIYSCVPPLPEQTAIVRYLDYKDKRIRRYINIKKKLIALLNEQKQAIIHQAVTHGLDPNVRLKPSGVKWLGDIPEHWEVLRIKRIARINPSSSNGNQERDPEEMLVFIPMERVTTQGNVDCSEFRPYKEVRQGFSHFRRGDVVVAKITPCFENGKGAYLNNLPTEIGFGTTEFIVLRASPKIEGEYLYLLTSLTQFRLLGVESMTGSAGQKRVSPDFVANFVIGLPPIKEQQEILKNINYISAIYNTAIKHAEKEVKLLREYRTRHIADVVTGKLDVREVAANLQEDVEGEPMEESELSIENGEAMDNGEETLAGVSDDE
jgi:type I restriction enzyme S subunit